MILAAQLRRQKAAGSLANDLAKFGPEIAKELEPRMAAVLEEGEKMPDVAHLLDVLGRMLVLESQGLETVTDARSAEHGEVIYARGELRNSVEPELRQRVVWVRKQMNAAFGAKEADLLLKLKGGRTPRAREKLEELAEHMVSFLPDLKPRKPKAGPPARPADWAEYVRPALAEFSRHFDDLGFHSENQKEVVDHKNEALATFDRNYSRIIRLGQLLDELSGVGSLSRFLEYQPWRKTGGRPKGQDPVETGEANVAPAGDLDVAPEAGGQDVATCETATRSTARQAAAGDDGATTEEGKPDAAGAPKRRRYGGPERPRVA